MEADLRNKKPPRFGRLSRKRPKPNEEAYCQDAKKEAFKSECSNISELVDDKEKLNPSPPFIECQTLADVSCPLPNIGSTCFFNSVIQILRFTPGFLLCLHQMTLVHSLWKNGEIPIILTHLHGLFMEMKRIDTSKENKSLSRMIEKILNLFTEDCSHYKFGRQFDAHEFLSWVLKIMLGVPEFDSKGKKAGASWGKRKTKLDDVTDFRSQFLNGELTTHLICCECENIKIKTEDYWDLAFKVNAQDLESETFGEDETADNLVNTSLLDLVCQETILKDTNKYFCDECLRHVEARLKIEIESFPQVLIFHPNQIGTATFSAFSKNLNALAIQETISCSHSKCVQPCDQHVYQIYGVVVHIGAMMHAGHYIALIKINPTLLEKHQQLLRMEERVQLQPLTRRLKRKISNDDATTKTCCWPNWLKENNCDKDGGWILFNDDTIELCKNDNIKQILSEELGILATPSVLLYYRR